MSADGDHARDTNDVDFEDDTDDQDDTTEDVAPRTTLQAAIAWIMTRDSELTFSLAETELDKNRRPNPSSRSYFKYAGRKGLAKTSWRGFGWEDRDLGTNIRIPRGLPTWRCPASWFAAATDRDRHI
jgi:hypothetical protein